MQSATTVRFAPETREQLDNSSPVEWAESSSEDLDGISDYLLAEGGKLKGAAHGESIFPS